jgi:protein-S-isoprenylcysteine O-methyltransferase Ste14
MTSDPTFLPRFTFYALIVGWFAFALTFALRRKPSAAGQAATRRDRGSWIGIVLQGLAFMLVWTWRRNFRGLIAPLGPPWDLVVAIAVPVLLIGSVLTVRAAVATLGKQWSLGARVVAEHDLITAGPYGLMRHPIYTGMFGMLLAVGLTLSRSAALLIGIVVFWLGTAIRIRSEEKLLRATFGQAYDAYAARVPAVLPWRWRPWN